jgi:VWFA-related protein
MKKVVVTLSISIALSVAGFAQQTKPTPPPSDPEQVVKIATDLIQVDVTATDKNGKVVTDLTADDFEIYENGQKQPISNFSFKAEVVGTTTDPNATGNPANAGNAPLTPGRVNRTIALIVDDLNLSFASIYYTRRALHHFVDNQMRQGDLVAIIRTGGNVGALQQFTADKTLLHSTIDKIRWNPLGNGGVDAIPAITRTAEDVTEDTRSEFDQMMAGRAAQGDSNAIRIGGRTRRNLLNDRAREYDGTKNFNEFQEGVFAVGSLGSMSYVVQGMQQLPGRKMMILFSDGIKVRSDSTKSRANMVYEALQRLVDTANRASVVVYTIDTRGLASMAITASDNFDSTKMDNKLAERFSNFLSSQDGLVMLANQTGGKALLNSNDINYGISRALQEQAGYYLIGYQPDSDTFDASARKFNKLEVKLKRPGVNISYRSGFFNTSDGGSPATSVSSDKRIADALMSPFASNEIGLAVNALSANDTADGGFVRSFLHIDAKNLKFTDDAEGWKKATFEVAAVAFGDNGAPAGTANSKYTIKTKGPTYQSMLQNGFVYVLIMPLKKPGLYQYRAVVMDEGTGKVGSANQLVEVPDVSGDKFGISGIGVEAVPMATWKLIAEGKAGNGPGQTPIISTFLYDTVLRRFRSGQVLRYGVEVYNAKADKSGAAKLESIAKIVQNDKIVILGQTHKVDGAGQPDPKNIRVNGNILLKDDLPPGDYVLHVMIRDTVSQKFSTQIFPFEIVK